MTLFMGIHQIPDLDCYWSSDPALNVPVVSNVMPCKRYKKINKVLHLNDNSTALHTGTPAYDKLHKVRPLVEQCYRCYIPSIKNAFR